MLPRNAPVRTVPVGKHPVCNAKESHSLLPVPPSHASLGLARCVKHAKQKEIKGHSSGWLLHKEHTLLFRNTRGLWQGL